MCKEPAMSNAVPVIDLAPYYAGDQQGKAAIATSIAEACEQRVGFFKVIGHGVPQAMIDAAFATAGAFFGQPTSVKDRFRPARSASARGYHALASKNLANTLGYNNPADLREQFYTGPLIDRAAEFAHIPEAADVYADNIWPDTPSNYRTVFTGYYQALESLGCALMRISALSLGMAESFFDDKIDRHFSTLPANHYPEPEDDPLPNQIRRSEERRVGK